MRLRLVAKNTNWDFFGKTNWKMRDTFKSGVYFCGGINFDPESKRFSLAVSNVPDEVKQLAKPESKLCIWVLA